MGRIEAPFSEVTNKVCTRSLTSKSQTNERQSLVIMAINYHHHLVHCMNISSCLSYRYHLKFFFAAFLQLFIGWRLHLIRPSAGIAPKIVVVIARVLRTVTNAGIPFFDHCHTTFQINMESRFIKKDTVSREIHVCFFTFTNPIQTLLNLLFAIPVYGLKPSFFERQIAMLFYKIEQGSFGYF
jgi:hypothetical protein